LLLVFPEGVALAMTPEAYTLLYMERIQQVFFPKGIEGIHMLVVFRSTMSGAWNSIRTQNTS
jgi:hypothetical protein